MGRVVVSKGGESKRLLKAAAIPEVRVNRQRMFKKKIETCVLVRLSSSSWTPVASGCFSVNGVYKVTISVHQTKKKKASSQNAKKDIKRSVRMG